MTLVCVFNAMTMLFCAGLLVWGISDRKAQCKWQYGLFIGAILVFLAIFSRCAVSVPWQAHAEHILHFLPFMALAYVLYTARFLGVGKDEKFICAAFIINTVAYAIVLLVSDIHVMRMSVESYAITTTLVDVFMGLIWSWKHFHNVTELKQARISVYFMATFLTGLAVMVNSLTYMRYPKPWSIAVVPLLAWFIACVQVNVHIIFLEKLLQELFLKITMVFGYATMYYGFLSLVRVAGGLPHGSDLHRMFFELFVLFVILTYRMFEKSLHRSFELIFFRPVFNYHLLFRNFSHALMMLVDVDRILRMIVTMFYETYSIENVSCFVYNESRKAYVLKMNEGTDPECREFSEDHPFSVYMRDKFDVVARETIRKERRLDQLLRELKTEVIIPFEYRDGLSGFIFLGPKKDGMRFADDDFELFNIVEGQISVALNNAYFFKTQRDTYELLAQKNKMDAVIALSGGVNHEINNPLSIISMKSQNFLRRIREGKFESEKETIDSAVDVIDSCLRNAGRAHMITRRLGDFAKPTRDQVDLEVCPILAFVQASVDLLGEKQLAHDNVTVAIDIDATAEYVLCDKMHLQQILFNIITNAYHAVGSNGTITISARAKDHRMVLIEVSDTGCGIRKEDLEKIWEPFFTTKPQKRSPGHNVTGSGLGLALVKRYVEQVGGAVSVTSEIGKGSTFAVLLMKASPGTDDTNNAQEGKNI